VAADLESPEEAVASSSRGEAGEPSSVKAASRDSRSELIYSILGSKTGQNISLSFSKNFVKVGG
jgi:hypothetical protein